MSLGTEPPTNRAETLRAAQVAWVAALPVAALTIAVAAVLGPPLGNAFLGPGSATFFAGIVPRPEPVEHARYLLSLLAPALLAGAILASTRRNLRMSAAAARRWTLAAQLALIGFVVVCLAAQYDLVSTAYRPQWEMHARYFTPRTLLVALAAPAALLLLLRRPRPAALLARLSGETRARRIGAAVVGVLLTAAWLLTAICADGSLANTANVVVANLAASICEPFAILNGRTPLVDFHAQYGQLVPYVPAAAMALFGASVGTFTVTMAVGSGLALLAIYAVLRRIVGSSLLALALYAPFLATGFFMLMGPLDDRYAPSNLFSLWPIRYGGPYLLAWLLARHVDRVAPRRVWPLFAVGGLVAINNPEFGSGAVAALAVALVLTRPPRSRAAAGRMLAEAAAGLALAVALVSLLTLARSGSLPHFGWALEFSKLYGIDGLAMVPLPPLGVYFTLYLTYAAAIAVAAVRVVRRDSDAVLTAMLAWSGTFGLLVGAYFAGRSHPHVLIDLFSPWALTLVLLTIVVARALAARDWRRPTLPELAVLFAFGLLVCSLAQTPTPWSQLARIRDRVPSSILKQATAAAFIAERTQPGEKIAILIPLGHRIAYDTRRVNVLPYASTGAILTRQQLDRAIAAVRREGSHALFISTVFTSTPVRTALAQAGFTHSLGQIPEGSSIVVGLEDGGRRPQAG